MYMYTVCVWRGKTKYMYYFMKIALFFMKMRGFVLYIRVFCYFIFHGSESDEGVLPQNQGSESKTPNSEVRDSEPTDLYVTILTFYKKYVRIYIGRLCSRGIS